MDKFDVTALGELLIDFTGTIWEKLTRSVWMRSQIQMQGVLFRQHMPKRWRAVQIIFQPSVRRITREPPGLRTLRMRSRNMM